MIESEEIVRMVLGSAWKYQEVAILYADRLVLRYDRPRWIGNFERTFWFDAPDFKPEKVTRRREEFTEWFRIAGFGHLLLWPHLFVFYPIIFLSSVFLIFSAAMACLVFFASYAAFKARARLKMIVLRTAESRDPFVLLCIPGQEDAFEIISSHLFKQTPEGGE